MSEYNWYTKKCIEAIKRINSIWYKLNVDDKYHQQLIEFMRLDARECFLKTLSEYEQYNTKRVEDYVHELRIETARWSVERKAFLKTRIDDLVATGLHKLKAIQIAYHDTINS